MEDIIGKAWRIAKGGDVSTAPDGAVVYSVSYMPTSENKTKAQTFVRQNKTAKMLDDTPCGKALIDLGLDGRVDEVGEEITKIWRLSTKSRPPPAIFFGRRAYFSDAAARIILRGAAQEKTALPA